MRYIEEHPVKVIFLCGLFIFLFHLNILPVTIMEARNFITAREMITDGHWLLTTMNDLPRYEKPPLPSWLTALSGLLFGIKNVAGLRIPTMLMAIVLCWVLYLLSFKLLQNKKQALMSSLIVMTSFYIIAITIEAPWDIYTHGFMVASILFLFQFFESQKNLWKHSMLAALFFGLSFMSKGPISLYGVLLPFLISYGIVFKYQDFKRKIFPLIAFLIVATAVSIWWFLFVRYADPDTFLAITKKETGNWSSYNVRPFYYYWSFFVQSGVWTIPAFMSLLYPYLKNKVANKKVYQFSLLWTIASLVLLSLIPEKKTRYLVPVLIPLAINTGFYIEYIIRFFKEQLSKTEKIPVYFHFGLLSLVGIAFPFAGYFMLKDDLNGLWIYFIVSAAILFTLGILLLLQLRKQHIKSAFYITIAFVITIKLFALPLAKAFQKNSAFNNINTLAETTESLTVYNFGSIAPEMIWHYGKSIPILKSESGVSFPDETTFSVLVISSEENEFKRIFEKDYSIELKEIFDINYNVNPEEKGHKNRFVSKRYLIKKRL